MRPALGRFAAALCLDSDGDGVLRLETVADAGAAEEVRGHGDGHEPVLSNSLTGDRPASSDRDDSRPVESKDLALEKHPCLLPAPGRFAAA